MRMGIAESGGIKQKSAEKSALPFELLCESWFDRYSVCETD